MTTATQAPEKTRKVPRAALSLASGPLTFAAPAEGDDGKKQPLKMRARSGQPIYHWYWGNVVHDMAGFSTSKPVLTADYCHRDDEILGFLNKFTPSDDGLDVEGELVSFRADDRSAEVIFKGRSGVPYEASIFFAPESIEEVMPGATAEVNGYELPGPALIIRKWTLRGVAVCPYGYDPRTSSQFAAGQSGDLDVPVLLTQPKEPATMPTETKPTEGNANALSDPPAKPADGATPPGPTREQFAAELKRFTDKFGVENGTAWYTGGKSYEQALELHVAAQAEQLAAAAKENGELKQKLAAAPRGEADPVSFSDGEGAPNSEATKRFAHLGTNLSKVAAGIKLPSAK